MTQQYKYVKDTTDNPQENEKASPHGLQALQNGRGQSATENGLRLSFRHKRYYYESSVDTNGGVGIKNNRH